MAAKIGTVASIVDPKKFIITFNIPGFVTGQKAYPLEVLDEPNIGDPIFLYPLEDKFYLSWMYSKTRLSDHTRIKLGNSTVDIKPDSINIHTQYGNTVNIDSDGQLTISSKSTINIQAAGDIDIQSSGKVSLNCNEFDVSKANKIIFPDKPVMKPGGGVNSGPFVYSFETKQTSNTIG